jgi:hypothetical protein
LMLVYLAGGQVIDASSVIMAIDWSVGKESSDNRELVGYARAHGFLVENDKGLSSRVLVVTSDNVYLLPGSLRDLARRLNQT